MLREYNPPGLECLYSFISKAIELLSILSENHREVTRNLLVSGGKSEAGCYFQ